MSAGLFALSCPQCNGELKVDPRGMSECAHCERAYLNRFGHLIPIEPHGVPFALPGESPTFAPGCVARGGA
jgi:hypothetical protein